MKFKATIRDPSTLASLCIAAKSFQQRCYLRLNAQRLRFITCTHSRDGCQVWSTTDATQSFSNVVLETRRQGREGAEIYCEAPNVALILAVLKSTEGTNNITVKLAKVDDHEVLRFGMQTVTVHGRHDASHDVAVRVMTDLEVAQITAPPLDPNLLRVYLPSLQDLSAFANKVRGAGCGSVTVTVVRGVGDEKTTLCFGAESMVCAYTLHYDDAEMAEAPGSDGRHSGSKRPREDEAAAGDEEDVALPRATATIDIRSLTRFISVKDLCPTRIVLHVVHDKALVLSAYAIGNTNVVYFIPGVITT